MFSDDVLFERLVLKGGNAVNLVHELGTRSSIDLDFSIDGDFDDIEDTKRRIFLALEDRFGAIRYNVFDQEFERRPTIIGADLNPRRGGYQVRFKIIEHEKYLKLKDNLDKLRIDATVTGPLQHRVFTIDISKYEYCQGKQEMQFSDYSIFVYTPIMLVIEKMRAICQQMPEYMLNAYKTPRARDFYDIHSIVTKAGVVLSGRESHELVRNIFAAKDVPLEFIPRISEFRDFHRQDWASVRDSVSGNLEDYDFYFEFVMTQIALLEPLWKV